MQRKITLTITRIRRQRIRQPLGLMVHCPVCERISETISRAEAREVLEIDYSALDLLIADGSVHTIRTASGGFRICKDSLFSS